MDEKKAKDKNYNSFKAKSPLNSSMVVSPRSPRLTSI